MATQRRKQHGNSNQEKPPAEISKEDYGPYYRPLLRAAFKGDWESAKRFFERDSASKTAKITSKSQTVLHIAALSARDQFLENLVELFSPYPEVLEMVDEDGRTALHNAVLCGRIRMVKALFRSNPKLTQLADKEGRVPLALSALEGSAHKEIVWFLAKSTTDEGLSHPFRSNLTIDFILHLTYAGYHDITLYLVGQHNHLLTERSKEYDGRSILDVLARVEGHFLSGTKLSVLEAFIYKCIPVDLNYKPTDKNSDRAFQCLTRSLWNAAKIVAPIIKRVHEVKLRHETAVKLAEQVCTAISSMNTAEITKFFKEKNLLYQATIKGISELVKLCINFFPELIQTSFSDEENDKKNDKKNNKNNGEKNGEKNEGKNGEKNEEKNGEKIDKKNGEKIDKKNDEKYDKRLTTHAVEFRQERTLRLFLKVSSTNELSLVPAPTLYESINIMWAATRYKPKLDDVTNVPGAAFQMQRELQWYKAVEMCVIPSIRKYQFKYYPPFWVTFVKNHKELLVKGEKWVKDTANSCMLVSTLIATVLFTAAFTVPGGNDGNTGVPMLLGQDSFLIFAISDALGLFSSVMAILLFLAILTSRYEPQDFLDSLPKKIIMGLSFLFFSLASMLVVFAASLTVVLDKRLEWVRIPITLLASIPVVLFLALQLPLLYQMVKSTYGPSIFHAEDIWD